MSENNENTTATEESIQDLGIPQIGVALAPSTVIQQPTDASLTAQGMPADAKAVGDRFDEVDDRIIELAADIGTIDGKVDNAVLFVEQDLDENEQEQARDNIGLGNAATYDVASDYTVSTAGSSVLDASRGKDLNDRLVAVENGLGTAAGYSVSSDYSVTTPGTAVLDASVAKELKDRLDIAVSTAANQGLSDEQQDRARANIGAVSSANVDAAMANVVKTTAQGFGPDAQAQARDNIGALGSSDVADVVRTSSQTISTAAQAQARDNIGAASTADLPTFQTEQFVENGLTFECVRWGRVGYITVHSGRTSVAAAQNETIITLPRWCRPYSICNILNTGESTHERLMIKADGSVEGASAVAANAMIRISATFVCYE